MKKKILKKAQKGMEVSTDSAAIYRDEAKFLGDLAAIQAKYGKKKAAEEAMDNSRKAYSNASRQEFKGKPGFDKLGNPIKKKTGTSVKK